MAERLGLTEYLHRKPSQLSGGQRQRVAMGRAIIRLPSVFLMDEPLSNLDAKLRVQMRADIASMQADLGVTTVYVTHDQSEAMTLGHRVAALKDGFLQQCDTPRAMYDRPVNTFVAGFIGSPAMNLCEVPVENGAISFGAVSVPVPRAANGHAGVVLGLRPEALELVPDGLPAEVEIVEEFGADAFAFCVADVCGTRTKLVARVDARRAPVARGPGLAAVRTRPRRTASIRSRASACQTEAMAYGRPVAVAAGGLLVALGVLGFIPGVDVPFERHRICGPRVTCRVVRLLPGQRAAESRPHRDRAGRRRVSSDRTRARGRT